MSRSWPELMSLHSDTDRRILLQNILEAEQHLFKATRQQHSLYNFKVGFPHLKVEFAAISLPHVQSNRLYLNKPITSSTNGKLVEDTQGSGVINCRTPNCSNYRSIAKLSEEVQRIRSGNERTRNRRKSAGIGAPIGWGRVYNEGKLGSSDKRSWCDCIEKRRHGSPCVQKLQSSASRTSVVILEASSL
ncbi:unnamed protein product [Sphagnum balticum]